MTDVAQGEKALPLMPGVHRVIRALDASDGPFVGLLVTRGDGVAVQLDARGLEGWAGWQFAGAEHVAGPLDVIRGAEGHDVLLPWCTERVASLLARRHVADEALSLGECSTLVASVLRGIDELAEGASVERGTWWITGDGRPVFAIGEGDDACAGASRVLEQLEEGCRGKAMGRLLASVQVGLRTATTRPRIPRLQIEEWENALFEIAAPRPLRCDVHAPERAREVARAVLSRPASVETGRGVRNRQRTRGPVARGREIAVAGAFALMRASRSLLERLRRHPIVDVESARRLSPGSRVGVVPRSRRRSLAIAGLAAVAVLAGGLLWPSGESGEAAEKRGTETPSPADSSDVDPADVDSAGTPSPGSSPSETAASETVVFENVDEESPARVDGSDPNREGQGPVAAVSALLDAALVCAGSGDDQCAEVVVAGSGAALPTLAKIAAAETKAVLVDEYGDVAVVRVGRGDVTPGEAPGAISTDEPAHILVLVRINENWLVRDVYDVAGQPE